AGAEADISPFRSINVQTGNVFEFPGPGFKAEDSRRERPNRANIGRVTAEIGIKWRVGYGDTLQSTPTFMNIQHISPVDSVLKTGAAGTLDAAFAVQIDQFAQRDMLGKAHLIFPVEDRAARTMRHRQILERALAALITDGAVQRVTGQQEFKHVIPCCDNI